MAENNEEFHSYPQRGRRLPGARQYNQYRGRPHPRGNYHNRPQIGDLREVLNKKRQERQETSHAPPDPSYNFLHDPSREGADRRPYLRGRGGGRGRGKDIENPKNIKIELTIATGHHIYTMDEATTLPTIKHIPDQRPRYYNNRGRGIRGRGRGAPFRGQSRGARYNTRTINRTRPKKEDADNFEDKDWELDNVQLNEVESSQPVEQHPEEEHPEKHYEEVHEYDENELHEYEGDEEEHAEESKCEEEHAEESKGEEEHREKSKGEEVHKEGLDLKNLNEKITVHVGEQERKIEIQEDLEKLQIKE